jgi:hypothetical protein
MQSRRSVASPADFRANEKIMMNMSEAADTNHKYYHAGNGSGSESRSGSSPPSSSSALSPRSKRKFDHISATIDGSSISSSSSSSSSSKRYDNSKEDKLVPRDKESALLKAIFELGLKFASPKVTLSHLIKKY